MQEVRGRDVPVYNDSETESIPPGALMAALAAVTDTGAVHVAKPDADSMAGLLVNGPFTIDPKGEGVASIGPAVVIAFAPDPDAEEEGGGPPSPAAGTYGSKAGSWLAHLGQTGFVAFGTSGADFGMVMAVRDGATSGGGGGGGASAGGCGFLSELVNWSGLYLDVLSRGGMCAGVDLTQRLLLIKTDNPGEWVPVVEYGDGGGRLVTPTGAFTVRFASLGCELPCLELTTTTGGTAGETTYRLFFDYCDAAGKFVVLAGSGPVFCDGDPTPCVGDDAFRVKLSCAVACTNECEDGTTFDVPAVLHGQFVGGDCPVLYEPFRFVYVGGNEWSVLPYPPGANRGIYQGCSADGLSNHSSGFVGACLPSAAFQVVMIRNSLEMPLMSCDLWGFTGAVTDYTCVPFSMTFAVTASHTGPNPGTNPCATTAPTSFVVTV